jgi:hypothetical protein
LFLPHHDPKKKSSSSEKVNSVDVYRVFISKIATGTGPFIVTAALKPFPQHIDDLSWPTFSHFFGVVFLKYYKNSSVPPYTLDIKVACMYVYCTGLKTKHIQHTNTYTRTVSGSNIYA